MNKGFKIFLITFLSILAISVVSIMVLFMTGKVSLKNFSFLNRESDRLAYTKEYEIKDIKIDVDMASIEVRNSTTDNVKVEIYSDYDKYSVTDDELLNVTVGTKKCHFFCINLVKSKLVIYIPETYNKKIIINSEYGDIDVEKFTNMDIDIDSDFGDISIDSAYNIKIDADYGDIKIGKVNNYLSIKEDFGDIKIDELEINKNSNINSDFGDVKIRKTNSIYIDSKTDFGDNKVNNNQESQIKLKIRTDFGDIKVNY